MGFNGFSALSFSIFFVVVYALTSFTFSLDPSSSLLELYYQKFDTHSLFWSIPAWDVASNFLLFIPFSLLFVSSPTVSRWNVTNRLLFTAVAVWLLSFTVEICQLFLPRAPSLVDTMTNTLGGFVGGLFGTCLGGGVRQWAHHLWLRIQRSRWLNWFLVVYVLILLVASGLPSPLSPNFSNWDKDYSFLLGNEATLDRPWLGKMFLVAVYDRALNPNEILTNFRVGASHKLGRVELRKA
jgi:VanZ family protein